MQDWTEREVRAAIGASPKVEDDEEYEPTGRHKWFAEVVAEIVFLFAMRRMSKTWQVRPPYPDWRHYAPALAQHADEQIMTAQLASGSLNKRAIPKVPEQEQIRGQHQERPPKTAQSCARPEISIVERLAIKNKTIASQT